MGKMADLYEQEQENRRKALQELIEISQEYGGYNMEPVKLEYKALSETAKKPEKAHSYDAAWDLFADVPNDDPQFGGMRIEPGQTKIVPTNIAIRPPRGYSCDIRGRSGMNSKGKLAILGLVDADYTGPWGIVMHNSTNDTIRIGHHDKIAQFTVNRVIESYLSDVDSFRLQDGSRGTGGFGSTGAK
jgi:dUTP pyrophosphatase